MIWDLKSHHRRSVFYDVYQRIWCEHSKTSQLQPHFLWMSNVHSWCKVVNSTRKINLLLSKFPASILDGVIVVLLWGIFSGFNWASTLLIRCFICSAFSQRMKEHNINSINLYILHDKISTTKLVDYALKPSDYPQPLWAQPPDTFIGNKSKSS